MRYIHVKNFDKYQHYSDRTIKWVKLYVDILHDEKFIRLCPNERWLFIGLCLLTAKAMGSICLDYAHIKHVLFNSYAQVKFIKKYVKTLVKMDLVAITRIAERYQLATLEENRIDKNRIDKSRETKNTDKVSLFQKAWKEMKLNMESGRKEYDPDSVIDWVIISTKMINWIKVNPAKKNWKKFITNWINGDLEKAGRSRVKNVKRTEAEERVKRGIELLSD